MDFKIGTDILYIPRLAKIIEKTPAFIKKVYTEKEQEIASCSNNPLYFFATRFAAKEAIIKASAGKFDFKEIEIDKDDDGSPLPKIIGQENILINLSLSFENEYAIAFCTLMQKK